MKRKPDKLKCVSNQKNITTLRKGRVFLSNLEHGVLMLHPSYNLSSKIYSTF